MFGILLLAIAAQDAPAAPPVILRLTPETPLFRPDGPMRMRFCLFNNTDKEATLDEPIDYREGLEIRDPEGRVVRAAGKLREVRRRHKLEGRGFFGQVVDLSSLLKVPPDREGRYEFRWHFEDYRSASTAVYVFRRYRARIRTPRGNIDLEFSDHAAPEHVLNFLRLVRSGFYKEARFYRLVPGFLLQAGKPEAQAKGTRLPYEPGCGKHVRGALSMLPSGSATRPPTEFFLCLGPAAHLDGAYTVFGRVAAGMEVVEKLEKTETDHSPCKKCGRSLPAKPTQHCGAHHQDRPRADIVIENIELSLRRDP